MNIIYHLPTIGKLGLYQGSIFSAINASCALGTRFDSSIPSQSFIPAVISGYIFAFANAAFLIEIFEERKKEGDDKGMPLLIRAIKFLACSILTIAITPTIASFTNRTISYEATAAYVLINNIFTLYIYFILPSGPFHSID